MWIIKYMYFIFLGEIITQIYDWSSQLYTQL